MATQTENIEIKVGDGGSTQKLIKSFEQLYSSIEKVNKMASTLAASTAATSAGAAKTVTSTMGSRAAAATSAGGSSALITDQQNYDVAKGIAGATGAAGRDFAKQAQGLGGLVHLYATFAANLFAVSAAFVALKNAADTSNMIKGLDQLGAASGRNLGSLAKEVVKLTDGAVSLREAMDATTKATASGMSGEDLKRMTVGAKQASQALGLDMTDALSRLSRGISKIEPELLDELGIFVKVDKAASDYARTLGKPVTALTEFEKRASFASAVLTEVETKFSNIKLDANPYSQLLAGLKDIMQVGLETINKVLGPLVSTLASSPTGLAVAIGLVAATLVKQAIPAINTFKDNLQQSTIEARKLAAFRANEAKAARVAKKDAVLAEVANEADVKLAAADNLSAALAKKDANNFGARTLAHKYLNMQMEELDRQSAETGRKVQTEAFEYFKRMQTKYASEGKDVISENYRKAGETLKAYIDSENKYTSTRSAREAEHTAKAKLLTQEWLLVKMVDQANRDMAVNTVKANAMTTASIQGPIKGTAELWTNLNKLRKADFYTPMQMGVDAKGIELMGPPIHELTGKINTLRFVTEGLKGTFMNATSYLGNLINVFGVWTAVIGVIGVGIGVLIDKASNTKKESAATASAMESMTAAAENAVRVITRLRDINPFEFLAVENIQARANAFNELSVSMASGLKRIKEETSKMNTVDKAFNTVKGLISSDIGSVFGEKLAAGLSEAFELAGNSTAAAKSARATVSKLLGTVSVDFTDQKGLVKLLKPLIDGGPEAQASLGLIIEQITRLNKVQQLAAASGTELKQAIVLTDKTLQDLLNSLIPTDNEFKLGTALMAEGQKMSLALLDPIQKLNTFKALLENPLQLAFLPSRMSESLITNSVALKEAINNTQLYTKAIEENEAELAKQEKALAAKQANTRTRNTTRGVVKQATFPDAEASIASLKTAIEMLQNLKLLSDEKIKELTPGLEEINKKLSEAGANIIGSRLAAEFAKGGAIITKAWAGLAPDTITSIKLTTSADNATIEAEKRLINVNIELIKRMYDNTQAVAKLTLVQELATEKQSATPDKIKLETLEKSLSELKAGTAARDKDNFASSPDAIKELIGSGVDQATIQLATKLLALKAELGTKGAQQAANNIAMQGKILDQTLANELKLKDALIDNNKVQLERLNLIKGIDNIITPNLLVYKQSLEYTSAQVEEEKKILSAKLLVDKMNMEIKGAGLENNKQAQADLKLRTDELDRARANRDIVLETLKAKQDYDRSTNELEITKQLLELNIQRATAIGTLGIQNSSEVVQLQANLDMLLLVEKQKQEARNLEQVQLQVIAELYRTTDEAKLQRLAEELDMLDKVKAKQDEMNTKKRETLTVMNDIKVSQAMFNDLASSLNGIFDTAGTKAGDFLTKTGTALASLSYSTQEYAKTMATLATRETSAKELDNQNELKDIAKERTEATKKNMLAELSANAAILSSGKKLFGEQTAAYKILNGMEKAMYIAKITMQAQEFATKVGFLTAGTAAKATAEGNDIAITEAGFMARSGTYITEIFSKFTAMMGPWGMAAAGAAIAAIGLTAFGGGGSSTGPSFVPNSEQMQQTQGTGTTWDAAGNKIDTGGGVFGDTSAKSASIANSLEIIKNNSVVGLSYDNKMLHALERVADSLTGAAQAIYTIPGLRQGATGFGTLAGSETTQGGLSSIPILGKIFGGSTTADTSIESAGIQLQGSLDQIITDTTNSIQQYKDVLTQFHKSGGWFGSDSDWTERKRETAQVSQEVSKAIGEVFAESKQLFQTVAEQAGLTADSVDKVFKDMSANVSIDLMGLKGDEVLAELNAVIGTQLDSAAALLFQSFDKFKKFGEGFLETVIRVTDTNTKIQQAMQNIGLNSLGNTLSEVSIVATEALAKTAGGIDKFVTTAETFRTTFLTPAEQLVPVIASVGEEMARLGFSSVTTKEQFVDLVRSLDLTTEYGRDTYQRLMDVSVGFDQVATAAEDARQKIADETAGLLDKLYTLQGKTNTQRAIELQKIDDVNKQLQLRIWAIEDYNKALTDANTALSTATSELKTATSAVTTIQEKATANYVAAQQKVIDAQTAIANLAVEAAKKMRDFGLALREFINTQLGISNQTNTLGLNARFNATIESALTGNQTSIAQVQSLADELIKSAQATSVSGKQFNEAKAAILSSVGLVASYVEQQAAGVVIPSEDPMVQAQKNLQDALAVQEKSLQVATETNSSLVAVEEDLVAQYKVAKATLNTAQATYDHAVTAQAQAQATLDSVLGTTGDTAIYAGMLLDTTNGTTNAVITSANAQIAAAAEVASFNNAILSEIKFNTAGTKSTIDYSNTVLNGIAHSSQIIANNTSESLRIASRPIDTSSVMDSLAYFVRNATYAGMSGGGNGSANGNVFNKGNQLKFAAGGIFTNSIVNTPTHFPIGLMGEAGPEAIMPLSRNSRGKLGVSVSTEPRSTNDNVNKELLLQVAALVEEVSQLRVEARATAVTSTKTTRILQRVTRDGESLLTSTV